ncbi:MAG: type II toxin-antitoxin system RelE/ParE family toxin [Kaistella sp.]
MRGIYYHENSLRDFQSGLDYYDNISTTLGDRFEKDFWDTINKIKTHPLHFQIRYSGVRVAFLQHFPFSVHFIVDDHIIEVMTVLHSKREF